MANQTRLSGTSDNESYTGIYALWIIRKPIKQTPWPYCIGLPWRTHRPLQTSWGPLSTPKHAPWPHWIFRITEQLKSRNVAWGIADFCTIYPGSCYHLLSVWYFKSTLGETGPSSPNLGSLSLFDSNCPLCTQQAKNADQFSAANFSLKISNAVQLCARRIASFYPNLPFENQFMLNSNVHSRPNATE